MHQNSWGASSHRKTSIPQTVGVTYAVETCREIQDFLISALLNEETSHPGGFSGQAKHNTLGVMNVMDGFVSTKNISRVQKRWSYQSCWWFGGSVQNYKLQVTNLHIDWWKTRKSAYHIKTWQAIMNYPFF